MVFKYSERLLGAVNFKFTSSYYQYYYQYYIIDHKAYADGLSVENLPATTVGNRQLSLYLKVNPPILVP